MDQTSTARSRSNLRQQFRRRFKSFRSDLRGEMALISKIRPVNEIVDTFDDRSLNGSHYLVSTKNGLYFVGDGVIRHLLDGQFYGLTTREGLWYAFQRLSQWRGRIIEFSLAEGEMLGATQILSADPGSHQMDFVGDRLLIADTYNNRIIVNRQEPDRRWVEVVHYHPNGELQSGRESANYAHMNSVWSSGSELWVVFHNETIKTSKPSELVRLDTSFNVTQRVMTDARNAHNVVRVDGELMYCDSYGGRLMRGGECVHRSTSFLRGLSISDQLIVVGQSQYGDRLERDQLKGALTVLDRNYQLRQEIPLPGMVQEVRAINRADLGLSTTATARTPTRIPVQPALHRQRADSDYSTAMT